MKRTFATTTCLATLHALLLVSAAASADPAPAAAPPAAGPVTETRLDWTRVDKKLVDTTLALANEATRWLRSDETIEGTRASLGALADALDAVPTNGDASLARATAQIREHAGEIPKAKGEPGVRHEIKVAMRAAADALASDGALGAAASSADVKARVSKLRGEVEAIPEGAKDFGGRMFASNALFAALDALRAIEAARATTTSTIVTAEGSSLAPPPKVIGWTDGMHIAWGPIAEASGSVLGIDTDAGRFTVHVDASRVVGADGKSAPGGDVKQGAKARVYYVVDNGAQAREVDLLR